MPTFHTAVAKWLVLQEVEKYGASSVLDDWQGSDEEALEAIRNDKREFFTFAGCDNLDNEGLCKGHK